MEIVYVLQVITICITVLTLIINVLITLKTAKQENYNNIITKSRLDFMNHNRANAAQFIAEINNVIILLKNKSENIDLKPLYLSYAQICIAFKSYNSIDKDILDVGKNLVELTEKSIINNNIDESLAVNLEKFMHLINIYDDADWKFIKQQFNSSNKNSKDFDKICDEVESKYKSNF